MAKAQLETLRELLKDNRSWVGLGIIEASAPAPDGSVWRVKVRILPDNNEIVARVARPSVGPNAGFYGPATVGDMCVLVLPNGEEDSAVVVGFLNSKVDTIPTHARNGDTVVQSLQENMLVLASLQKVLIGLGNVATPANENLVLGQVLKTALSSMLGSLVDLCTLLSTHTHVGNLGAPTSVPVEATDFTDIGDAFGDIKSSPVDDEEMLSDIAFTEKGA